jgi:hypothetical protein
MKSNHTALPLLRIAVVSALVLFAFALLLEWRAPLSSEAQRYQAEYPDAIRSGLSLSYVVARLLCLVGAATAVIGGVLVSAQKRKGLLPLFVSAPLIAAGALLFAPESAYPSVEPMYVMLLWCAAAACWGSAVSIAFFMFKVRP